jgi:cyanophycin synthetase
VPNDLPFQDSRRLTGSNLFFTDCGAVLDVTIAVDEALIGAWRERVARAADKLTWQKLQVAVRRHAGGVLLAITAPLDQLLLATEVNEWALCSALVARDPKRWVGLRDGLIAAAIEAADDGIVPAELLPAIEDQAAYQRFALLASRQASPQLREILKVAADKKLPYFIDDTELTLGAGAGSRNFLLAELPAIRDISWSSLTDVPTAIITGSNGKTTTVRLVAACARAHGWRAGYNCTDGVFIGDEAVASGDYSGPAGARKVMRDLRTQAAVIEAARGGILRRGVAISQANVAVVTNISSDHFGEYGIDDLDGLADVKLTVAAVVQGGWLILNADDALLRAKARDLTRRLGRQPSMGWFAYDADQPHLREYRVQGASTCGVRRGQLVLQHLGSEHDLGAVAALPLSIGGLAIYNVANLAGAALAAISLGIPAATIAAVFANFGNRLLDNPGRMMRFKFNGAEVLIDYAHNPDGLRGFLMVATQFRGPNGRLGLLLGHAGNRKDADIVELARAAAEFKPDLVVIKEDDAHLRGRALSEVPRIIKDELLRLGLQDSALPMFESELEAAQFALKWALPGDVLALPVHSPSALASVVAMLTD